MTSAALLPLLLVALVVYGLERNHSRRSRPHLAGHVGVVDRDARRVRDELLVVAGREEPARHVGRTYRPVLRPVPCGAVHTAR
ncbi:hypothetical protein [Umezawaea beigongshangensis]|uniref:hypothetical protein n=1 Tax=Umezawaea beigongshangensis TaxID=2780383 RepID=UPI0018F1E649|nr:hypothetical protein [Umezawaea beigongshangensis]